MRAIILEDSIERQREMQAALADRFPALPVEFFAAVRPMIERLEATGLYDVALLSLDHDLELLPDTDGGLIDPGTGVELADWLAAQPAVAPVIVHTTNTSGGDAMTAALEATGWEVARIVPYGGESWIREIWRPTARDLIVQRAPEMTLSQLGVKILQADVHTRRAIEWTLREMLLAAAQMLQDGASDGVLSLELLYSDERGRLRGVVGVGPMILQQYIGGTPLAVIQEVESAVGAGPISPTDQRLASELSGLSELLQEMKVGALQLDVIEPLAGYQAILLTAIKGEQATLAGPRSQSLLRELGALLALALAREISAAANLGRQRTRSS